MGHLAWRSRTELPEILKYAEKFRRWTFDWFRSNPYPIGINYCSALELAYRNYAWLWSLSFFSDYLSKESDLLDCLLGGIWTASRHVEENLSMYFAPNTHILGEAFGLYAVGAAIPEFSDAPRWRTLGLRLLEAESQKQFSPGWDAPRTVERLPHLFHGYLLTISLYR